MAFTTTQRLDNALMRNLNVRTPLNVPISTQYTMYANGQGQTYWSNSVSPTDLSTVARNLSTSIYNLEYSVFQSTFALSTALHIAFNDIQTLSTSLSTNVAGLLSNDSNLSNGVLSLSNNLAGLAYSNSVQINNIYNSTVQYVSNTLMGYSNLSTFYLETNNLLGTISSGLSSLSTTIGQQNTSTYNSITSNYVLYVTNEFLDYDANVSSIFSSIFANYATNASTQSSISALETQTQTSINDLEVQIENLSTFASTVISTIYFSSINPINSQLLNHDTRISSLELLSTNLSSISNRWISTFVSTSQGIQDSTVQSSVTSLSYLQSSLTASTIQNASTFAAFSTIASYTNINNSNAISTLSWQVSSLMFEYSVLTTSSILGGIYLSFMQLETYTYGLLTSTYSTNEVFQSSLLSTSEYQIESTASRYFNFYVSTMYASTLSTLIPSTQAYYSSIVSTTLWFALSTATSTINIVAASTATAFYSTTSSLTKILLDSTATQLNSSILGNLVIPTQTLLSSFSTSFGTNMNTYSTQFTNQLGTQSTMFSSLYCFYSSALSTLVLSSLNTYSFLSTQTSSLVSSVTGQFSTFSTQFARQLSIQTVIFNSSIAVITTGLASTLTSTTNSVYNFTISSATNTLTIIQNSTLQTYNDYVIGLNNSLSTAAYSSIYTEQVLNLTSNTSNVTMDMATFRNFNINVYNILSSNAKYRVTYNQNTLLGLNYRTGFIFINVSTVGQNYTSNNSQLQFDAYQWGIPTTVFGSVYPYISNADYTLQYQYVIQNNVLFTNLLNVYPRLRIQTVSISPVTSNVFDSSNVAYSNAVWRGTPMNISWTKYSFFPSAMNGTPPFNPNVLIDMRINNSTVAEYGPFSFDSASAIVEAPYINLAQSSNVLDTLVRVYIAGAVNQAATNSFTTVLPAFDSVRMLSPLLPTRAYVGGTELVAITDNGGYPLYSTSLSFTSASGQPSFDGTSNFIPQNINNGLLNRVGANGFNPTSLLCSTIMPNTLPSFIEPESLQSWNTIRTANVTQTATKISKNTGTNTWDATAYAVDGFTSTVFASVSPNATNQFMSFGMDAAPAGKISNLYNYTWYFDGVTTAIYTFGVFRGTAAYSTANRYAIYYDGARVVFLLNGVEQYSEPRSVGAPLYFACSFFSATSEFNNVVYSPYYVPVGIIKDASQEIGSTTFFVNSGAAGNTYFSNISSLRQYGTSFTFTLSRLTSTVQFTASSIQLSTGTTSIWRIDSGVPNSNVQFTRGNLYMNYSYTPVTRISSSAFYVESTFCGPSSSIADTAVELTMNSVNIYRTPISTLLYYNLLGNPVQGISTNGMLIRGTVTSGGNSYTSTFITNGSSNVQIFKI